MYYTHVEDYVESLFLSIGVFYPNQLDAHYIAKKLGVEIVYRDHALRFANEVVLRKGSDEFEWQLFGHEICHYLIHAGCQLNMHPLFIDLQEYQANHFSYHFCVPTFMLRNLENVTVQTTMMNFTVDYDFACRRLEMYKNKFYSQEVYHESHFIGS
ncbi:ImmA/IrrE family metallo-endopeptidase [Virgibacillus salexigens]|uniref:ImmA/IrrE family metallo-endopeptidase n=1 Tax=Virgibacillus salexigens TaxID=61016 RepID=UPI00190AB8EC|nr:ImmA/IrrE family metallo-endopeptidase [Virgibacillus salexigens]